MLRFETKFGISVKLCFTKMGRSFERSIQISSVNRERSGVSKPEDFVIKFAPALELSNIMFHEIAMNKVNMTYSWHNISSFYKNNTIKYSPDSGR